MTTFHLAAPPKPGVKTGFAILQSLIKERSLLGALSRMQKEMGDEFRISLPGFDPIVLIGPEANRFILTSGRDHFLWRNEADPVTNLFQHGLLVLDGEDHDRMRRVMNPALHRRMLGGYLSVILESTDEILDTWSPDRQLDLLIEMRKITLLIIIRTLFSDDFSDQLAELMPAIMRSLRYISPGPWLLFPGLRRSRYPSVIRKLDDYLFQLIEHRRQAPDPGDDLLGMLLRVGGLTDQLIRDQMITMLIAGHDTSTSLLSWAIYMIGSNPKVEAKVRQELSEAFGPEEMGLDQFQGLEYLELVSKETLRMYPPIHLGSRLAAEDLDYQGFHIPAGRRVIYSIYLTHRLERYWPSPNQFDPSRFNTDSFRNLPPYTYLPFGGGPRNCIGFAFAQLEVKAVLARFLQRFEFQLTGPTPRVHMGASLEPRPGVFARVRAREGFTA